MKNKYAILFLIGFFSLSILSPISAKNSKDDVADLDIPEKNGVYDVPGHPNLKVKVFVYKAKPVDNPIGTCTLLVDSPSAEVVGATGWHLPKTWTYELNLNSVPSSVGSSKLPTIAQAAFAEFTKYSNINFVNKGTTYINKRALDYHNIITWGQTSGSALAVTYIWYYPSTGAVVDVDTIMNKKFAWTWTPYVAGVCVNSSTYDAQNILTHELGHWLGLDDEYTGNYINNTMYGYGAKGEIKKDTLTQGDIDGLKGIYLP